MHKFRWSLLLLLLVHLGLSAETLKDPTAPFFKRVDEGKDEDRDNTKVQGIIITRTKRLALINGKYLTVGDWAGFGGRLVAILKDRVVLRKNGKMKVHFLVKKEIRKSR